MKPTSVDILYFAHIAPKRYAQSPVKSSKKEILQSKIDQIYIVVQPVINPELRNKMSPLISAAKYFPSRLSLANYTHTSLFVVVNGKNGKFSIKIEYGGYDDRREGDYEGQVHYFNGRDGLRFIRLTQNDFNKFNEEQNIIISCNFQYNMTIRELLYYTQFCGHFCSWNMNNFDLIRNNCQKFVQKVVRIIGCTRKFDYQKSIEYSRMYIPSLILNALIKNEKIFDDDDDNENNTKSFENHKKSLFGENYIPYVFLDLQPEEEEEDIDDESNDEYDK